MAFLLNLPTEIRLEIYHYLFTSTRLTYQSGGHSGPECHTSFILALNTLHTCRLIHREASPLWLDLVTFEFPDSNTFADIASAALEAGKLNAIKHVAMRGTLLTEIKSGDGGYGVEIKRIASYLKIFFTRGLELDTFTLFNIYHSPSKRGDEDRGRHANWPSVYRRRRATWQASSACFLALINLLMSEGWRECRFVSSTFDLFDCDQETLGHWLENEDPTDAEMRAATEGDENDGGLGDDMLYGPGLWARRLEGRFGRAGEIKYRKGEGECATMELRAAAEGVKVVRDHMEKDPNDMDTLLLRHADVVEDENIKEGFVVVAKRGTRS